MTTLVVALWIVWSEAWDAIGVPNPGVHFGDLRVVLRAAECAAADPTWSMATPPCREGMEVYNYPSIWAKAFAAIGGTDGWALPLALILAALFALSLSTLAYLALGHRAPASTALIMTAAGVMPPILLAYERANIDLVVFAVITVATVAYSAAYRRSSAIALAVATALKLFPLGAAAMLAVDRTRSRSTAIVYAVAAVVGLLFVVRDIPLITARTPQMEGASFGAAVLPLLVTSRVGVPPGIAKIIGLVGFALVLSAIVLVVRRSPHGVWNRTVTAIADDRLAAVLFLSSGSFVVAYLVGPSFDYRLMFLIPAAAALARVNTPATVLAAWVLVVQLLLSYSTFIGAVQFVSDLMLVVIVPALVVAGAQVVARRWSTASRTNPVRVSG